MMSLLKKLKERTIEDAIFFDRVRTILCLSKYNKIELYIVLCESNKTIGYSRIVNGIIDEVENGNSVSDEYFYTVYDKTIGGRFSFQGGESYYDMSEITAISFEPMKKPEEAFDNNDNNLILNFINHIKNYSIHNYYNQKLSYIINNIYNN